MELKEVKTQSVLVDQKKTRKKESCESHVLKHLKKQSKWILVAVVFDLLHYNIYPWFDEQLHLYVYDSTQSIAFLFYIYAIYKLIPDKLVIMHVIMSMWLWFSIGDVFNVVYNYNAVNEIRLENILLLVNTIMLCYKFRDYLYLQWAIFEVNLKIDKYEGVLAKN